MIGASERRRILWRKKGCDVRQSVIQCASMERKTRETPAFVIDEARLKRNAEILASVRERTGCKVLLALKAFATWPLFSILREHLDGVCASSPWEARLGRETFGKEVHAFAAAYSEEDFEELNALCDGIDFNSFAQLERFRSRMRPGVRYGLRINPERSVQDAARATYDPCAPRSRLGIRAAEFSAPDLSGISGLHFHALCEQNADALERMLEAVEERFGDLLRLPEIEWVNFGGGHHVTRDDYDVELLCRLISEFEAKYATQVVLEPGEAVALDAGELVASVLDVVENEGAIAILDVSCTCHLPDVMEMPYRPEIVGAGRPGEKPFVYRLTGPSCLAGDVIGDYAFDEPLAPGRRLVFLDMAHYTLVKTTFFNGIRHPDVLLRREDGSLDLLRHFEYVDFKRRLG